MLQKDILVLNSSWIPICTINIKSAIKLIFKYSNGQPKAKIIDHKNLNVYDWNSWMQLVPDKKDITITTPKQVLRFPLIIILQNYNKLHNPKLSLNKKNLFKRDNGICQYCEKLQSLSEATIDHIVPKSKGGLSVWTNCVICCKKCNSKKADKTLEQSGLTLLHIPVKPNITHNDLMHIWDKLTKNSESYLE